MNKKLLPYYNDTIKYCILNGIWYLNYVDSDEPKTICGYDMSYMSDMMIDSISKLNKDFYMVKIYYDKLETKNCFDNGYLYTTNRVVKLSDLIIVNRTLKLNKIVPRIVKENG